MYADFHDIEYNAIREQAALIDVTPLYKYEITGPDAARLVDRVMTRDVSKLAVDRVIYTPWCNEDGKVVDDGTVTRRGDQEFFWTAADPCYRWFTMNAAGLDVRIDDVSEQVGGRRPAGPARAATSSRARRAQDWADVRYFGQRRAEIAGVDVHVTRTGYTGDLGYELWVDAGSAHATSGTRSGRPASPTGSAPPGSARSTSRASRPA